MTPKRPAILGTRGSKLALVQAEACAASLRESGIEVEVRAGGGTDVPAESDRDCGQVRSLLGQRDVSTLAQADAHVSNPFVRLFQNFVEADHDERVPPEPLLVSNRT